MDNLPIQNREEQQEAPVEDTPKGSSFKKMYLLIAIVILIVASGAIYLLLRNTASSWVPTSKQQTNQAENKTASLALLPYSPHFDKLSLEDLPNFSDVRNVYDFNGHKLVVGFNMIVEYDVAKRQIIRQSNPDIIDCVYSSALIGNTLFVGCNGKTSKDYSTMYQIDLQSGKLVKQYEWLTTKGYKMENIGLASLGNTLWISSWDGIMKMDSKTGQTVFYKPSQVFPNNCTIDDLWAEGGKLIAHSGHYLCTNGQAIYDTQTNTWQYHETGGENYAQHINKNLSDFSLDIPQFYAVSEFVNNKYYAFSQAGVYMLQKDGFPSLFFPVTMPDATANAKAYVTNDETKAVVIGTYMGMYPQHPTVSNLVFAYIIDLKSKEVSNIVKSNPSFDLASTLKEEQDIDSIPTANLEENAQGLLLHDGKGTSIASINFRTKTLTFE